MVIPIILLQMCNHLTRKTQRWLYVPYRGYTSHVVVMRGYTWLHTAYVPKRYHNLQTMVIRGYTIKAMVIRRSSWLYNFLFSLCVSSLPGKPSSGYESMSVVIRLISWLFVVIRGYILHMCQEDAITFIRWFYVVIRSKPWLYDPVRGYTAFFLLKRQHFTRKTDRWLCVPDCGYRPTSHIVVMRGFTWLYTVTVPIKGVRTA